MPAARPGSAGTGFGSETPAPPAGRAGTGAAGGLGCCRTDTLAVAPGTALAGRHRPMPGARGHQPCTEQRREGCDSSGGEEQDPAAASNPPQSPRAVPHRPPASQPCPPALLPAPGRRPRGTRARVGQRLPTVSRLGAGGAAPPGYGHAAG